MYPAKESAGGSQGGSKGGRALKPLNLDSCLSAAATSASKGGAPSTVNGSQSSLGLLKQAKSLNSLNSVANGSGGRDHNSIVDMDITSVDETDVMLIQQMKPAKSLPHLVPVAKVPFDHRSVHVGYVELPYLLE